MELKHDIEKLASRDMTGLLIVPYGIETNYMDSAEAQAALLIVPYGIET